MSQDFSHEYATPVRVSRPPPPRHRHLRTRVVPSTRIVKRGNRQRTVEMRVAIRIVPRRILQEAEIIPERPEPQNMPNLVQC